MANLSAKHQQDPSVERTFQGHRGTVTSLAFRPSMSHIASASADHSVMLWSFKPEMRALRFSGHKGAVTGVDFNPSGNLLASSSLDSTIRLWTPTVQGDVTVFKAHSSGVRSVKFGRDGTSFVSTSNDKSIKVWSTARAQFQYTLAGHVNWVRSANFSPDGRLIASGSDDKTVKLWATNTKSCIKTYWDHTATVTNVAFHPSGCLVASASLDKSIKIFDLRTHGLIQHYGDAHSGSKKEECGVNSVCFGGSNGEFLLSTGLDGLTKIWDIKEGHLLYTLHGHQGGATTVAVFSPQGNFFASSGADSRVLVWKTNFDFFIKESGAAVRRDASSMQACAAQAYGTSDLQDSSITSSEQLASLSLQTASVQTSPLRASPARRSRSPVRDNTSNFENTNLNQGVVTPRKLPMASPQAARSVSPVKGKSPPSNVVSFANVNDAPQSPSLAVDCAVEEETEKTLLNASPRREVNRTVKHLLPQLQELARTMALLEARVNENQVQTLKAQEKLASALQNMDSFEQSPI